MFAKDASDVLGLQGAGKTTAMYKLKLGEVTAVSPTVGKVVLYGEGVGFLW